MKRPVFAALALALLAGCGGGGTSTDPAPTRLALRLEHLLPLDAGRDGRYAAWVLDRAGRAHALGALDLPPSGVVELPLATADAESVLVTVEPPGAAGTAPSPQRLLVGAVRGGRAALSVAGAVTLAPLPLRDRPGQFTMFSPSDNAANGYPSHEEAGIWLFNMEPRSTPQNDMWVRLTPLQPGWTYEGWMVRDLGTPGAVWLSYGKFRPDVFGAVNSRDDTGWGPFSGVLDFLAGEEEFPGDDWIANPLGLAVPGGLALPLDLRERDPAGSFRWSHVITIEPVRDRGEPYTTERPFTLRPYRDLFGDAKPGAARTLTYHADAVPAGTAELR